MSDREMIELLLEKFYVARGDLYFSYVEGTGLRELMSDPEFDEVMARYKDVMKDPVL